MKRECMKLHIRVKLMAAFAGMAMAALSHASSNTLMGGGPTLPAIAYAGTGALSNILVNPPGTGSLFGVWTSTSRTPVSYCQTRDVDAWNIFVGTVGYNVQKCLRA